MHARTYVIALSAIGATLFAAVAAANLVIDPQQVFGTGLIPRSDGVNNRFVRFAAYQADADRYDGFLFGSSRARFLPRDELSRRMNGAQFADFAVDGGALTDHLPVLEYVVRQKAARNRNVRAVALLLDIDYFGSPTSTNRFNNTLLPAEVTGESVLRFRWRHLTWIQLRTWRRAISQAWAPSGPGGRSSLQSRSILATLPFSPVAAAHAQELPQPGAPAEGLRMIEPVSDRVDFDRQLDLLRRFVQLCRDHGIALVVILSPLHPSNVALGDPDLGRAIERVGAVVPVWDFTRSPQLHGNRPGQWLADRSHFTAEVGVMMLQRAFGEEVPDGWKDFGRRVP
jgi:hypothetical protein